MRQDTRLAIEPRKSLVQLKQNKRRISEAINLQSQIRIIQTSNLIIFLSVRVLPGHAGLVLTLQLVIERQSNRFQT
jgi:hypothetical protein